MKQEAIKQEAMKQKSMKQASLITLGCKVNSYDTAVIWEGLEGRGYKVSDSLESADLYIINTCTVTNSATSRSRQLIRKAKKLNPCSVIVVTGCYAQVEPEEVSAIEGIDYVIGNNEKNKMLEIIDKKVRGVKSSIIVGNILQDSKIDNVQIKSFINKSRAFLKIQDGCEAFCTYCIIPYARGNSRSLPVEDIVAQAHKLSEAGYKEIVLSGIHLGAYGLDLHEKETLLSLLQRLDSLNIDVRFRISSIEPTEIDDEMLDFLISSKKICRHLHIPLQSGDDDTLIRMGRKYDLSFYSSKIEKIVSAWEGVSIGADIMAGFPGEDGRAFLRACDFIKSLPVSYLHVFPYSVRKGTPAASMAEQVDSREKKKRCKILRDMGEEKKNSYYSSFAGKRLKVINIEKKGDFLKTLSDNYIEIYVSPEKDTPGSSFDVEITAIKDDRCYGRRL